jgi:glutaredoxin-like protein NrdH
VGCQGGMMSEQQPVNMYTLSTCSHCKAAKKFLSDHGIRYEFTDVDLLAGDDRTSVVEQMRKVNPQLTFPTILIGEYVIIGNREDQIREALGLS